MKKFEKILAILLLIFALLIPLLLFLNRVLEPDVSCDSLNYHLYLGFKGLNSENSKYEFYPTGIHNFSPLLETVGYSFYKILGYRMGTIFSIVAIYLSIFALSKIFKLILPKKVIWGDLFNTFLFSSCFLSFELFLGIGSYFNDVLVAMLTVWGLYFILKYFKTERLSDLILSSLIISISVLGKQTNLYIALTMGMLLVIDAIGSKSKLKIRNVILAGVVLLFLPLWWYLKNWQETANPVFPFFNSIFKSIYFPPKNFHEPQFGGANLWQRIMWGYFSIFSPDRLGQVHDLFHDFKINFYFLFVALLSFIYISSPRIKDKLTTRLLLFFWLSYFIWSLQFGYLRYALALEFLGGLIVLIMFNKLENFKYLIFVPACLWLLLQNKRVVNLSLAYDISFRPGYFYNRSSYFKNFNNLFNNSLKISNDRQTDIYLNCSVTGMTHYVLSPFNNLPVLNIDQTAYKEITDNKNYMVKQRDKLIPYIGDKSEIKFVTIAAKTGLNTEYNSCMTNLRKRGWNIDYEEDTTFVGHSDQKINVIWGAIPRDIFDKIGD